MSATHIRPPQGAEQKKGFTLIEISIVLVIIGLIAGSIFVGQDMIKAAQIRSQITQIERYQTATNTFRTKYGYLPGDMLNGPATRLGFIPRGQYSGEGDGNGIIEGNQGNCAGCNTGASVVGETSMFWADLSAAALIDGNFNVATPNTITETITRPELWMPSAKIGTGVYIYAAGFGDRNKFYLSGPIGLGGGGSLLWGGGYVAGYSTAVFSLTVQQAYAIDTKTDDGMPGSGHVRAEIVSAGTQAWAAGASGYNLVSDDGISGIPNYAGFSATSTSCFDNANTTGTPFIYSVGQNDGSGVNCALSFRM